MAKVFVDSDVVISALLSETGAAYWLITKPEVPVELFISNVSLMELRAVAKRLNIPHKHLSALVEQHITVQPLAEDDFNSSYGIYVTDPGDAHIVTGAVAAKTDFLVTYNQRHFQTEALKRDFDLVVFTPAQMLQYIRSIGVG